MKLTKYCFVNFRCVFLLLAVFVDSLGGGGFAFFVNSQLSTARAMVKTIEDTVMNISRHLHSIRLTT
jgi:hypothetical protein